MPIRGNRKKHSRRKMGLIILFFVLSVLGSGLGSNFPGIKTSETFNQSVSLDKDGNYVLFWNFNDSHLTFEVHVRTKGWVGFGVSGNGNMFPSDVIVGWVLDDGTVHFSDRHTVGHQMPVMDKSQDWFLLTGEENEFGTVLKFIRKINTCDDSEDKVIQEGTTRLIYAFGSHDPMDENDITYHGTTRGTKSVSLLSPETVGGNLPTDTKHIDFLNGNYIVPNHTTMYHCRGFKLPPIGKHHMIKYEVILTPGNEQNVHHMILYRCNVNDPDKWEGVSDQCYLNFGKRILPQCSNAFIAWAIGGGPYYFPDNVGFSMGGPEDANLYIMETHYDNPTQKSHMIDNSGFRITVTPTLRPHEAGMLTVGAFIDESQVVPPGLKHFVSKNYCHADCLNEGFTQSQISELKVFGVLQHAHLLGEAIQTRHFRNGSEIKPLMKDMTYDFNFQQTRTLQKEVSVYPGDSFQVDCIYDSTGKNTTTFGGYSTQEEMCLSFLYYYPRMKLGFCESRPLFDNFPFDRRYLKSEFETMDWSNDMDYFLSHVHNSTVRESCFGVHLKMVWPPRTFIPSEPAEEYTPQAPDCS